MTAVGPLTVRLSEPTPATDAHPSRRFALRLPCCLACLPACMQACWLQLGLHAAQRRRLPGSNRYALSRCRLACCPATAFLQYAHLPFNKIQNTNPTHLLRQVPCLTAVPSAARRWRRRCRSPTCLRPNQPPSSLCTCAALLQRHLPQQGLGRGAANHLQRLLHAL